MGRSGEGGKRGRRKERSLWRCGGRKNTMFMEKERMGRGRERESEEENSES